jgi:hypothetical protein
MEDIGLLPVGCTAYPKGTKPTGNTPNLTFVKTHLVSYALPPGDLLDENSQQDRHNPGTMQN